MRNLLFAVIILFCVLGFLGSAAAVEYNEAPMLTELVEAGELPPGGRTTAGDAICG